MPARARFGAYGTTVISFFLIEIGDKTQLATVALAAKYQALIPVVAGTTLGMLIADVPVIFLGRAAAESPAAQAREPHRSRRLRGAGPAGAAELAG